MLQFMADKAGAKQVRDMEEAGLELAEEGGSKAGRIRNLKAAAYSEIKAEWLLPGLTQDALNKFATL